MSNIIINSVELGDLGEESRNKINNNDIALKNSITDLDNITVKKTDISQTLGTSQNKLPSEYAVSNILNEYAKKSDAILGIILKGVKANETEIKAIGNPQKGDTYKAIDTGHYWTYDGAQWNDIGEVIPNNVATQEDLQSKATRSEYLNVSSLNNKYDYADNTAARNAIPANLRGLGQRITYCLTGNNWVKEQFIGASVTTNWSDNTNWTKEGGLSEENIHQKIDETTDKPVSPNAVLEGILNIKGIGYRTITESEENFNNIIVEKSLQTGQRLNSDGLTIANDANWKCNLNFNVVPDDAKGVYCLTNAGYKWLYPANVIFIYNSAQALIKRFDVGGSGMNSFLMPSNAAFIRFNVPASLNSDVYVYPVTTSQEVKSDEIEILTGSRDLADAEDYEYKIIDENILPANIVMTAGALTGDNTLANGIFHTEDYFPIEGGVKYTTDLSVYAPFILFYDKNYNFITSLGTSFGSTPYGDFTTPQNARFYRFNARVQNVSAFSIYKIGEQKKAVILRDLVIPRNNIIDYNTEQVISEVIPYASDGNAITVSGYFGYADQSTIQGKHIQSIKVNVANAGTISVIFAADNSSTSILRKWDFPNLPVGENVLTIEATLGTNAYLLVSGSYRYNTTRNNPIGGGSNVGGTMDLCYGVSIYESASGDTTKKTDYIALGDSITLGTGASLPYSKLLSLKLRGGYTNYATGMMKIIGTNGLITQVNKIQTGFKGLITLMMGNNDANSNVNIGDAAATLAKESSELDINESTGTVADAIRYNIEAIINKAPDAIFVNILPLLAFTRSDNRFNRLEQIREVMREICGYYSIPCLELYSYCKIAPYTYAKYEPDGVHPNDAGHEQILRVLYPEILNLL